MSTVPLCTTSQVSQPFSACATTIKESERGQTTSRIKNVALVAIASMVSFVFYGLGFPALSAGTLAAGGLAALVSWYRNRVVHAYVNVPSIYLRESPTEKSKVASQAIFAEKVELKKTAWNLSWPPASWSYIAASDGYKGWVPSSALVSSDKAYLAKKNAGLQVSNVRGGYLYSQKETVCGPKLIIPYKSRLEVIDSTDDRWVKVGLPDGKQYYIQKGDVAPEQELTCRDDLVAFSKKFLKTHYAFGGKSGSEYDCSGFVQMLYKAMHIDIPRDSKDQANDPQFEEIDPQETELLAGDLVFWGADEDNIRHVGMCLGGPKFIHAAVTRNRPWVRINKLYDHDWSGNHPSLSYRKFMRFKQGLFTE